MIALAGYNQLQYININEIKAENNRIYCAFKDMIPPSKIASSVRYCLLWSSLTKNSWKDYIIERFWTETFDGDVF